ncbi:MAG TPA: DNA-binding protein WhiA [Clostridia bacterium]|nr:DNA-binding protein WhiA [Clostridia bacterium]
MSKENVTFSQKVKNEILNTEKAVAPCCQLAYLSAIIRGAGSLAISSEGTGFEIVTGNLELLKFVNSITKRLYGKQNDIIADVGKGKQMFSLDCYDSSLMFDTGILFVDENALTQINSNIDKYLLAENCCKKSYIKGMFLACGSLTVPEIKSYKQETNASYHMEFQISDTNIAIQFAKLLNETGFAFKLTERSKNSVVYIKDKDSISDMLVYFGANACKFALEDVLIARSIRNDANRQTNCISANIDKTLEASERQIAAITKLIESGKLNLVDEKLRQTADMRMEHIDASMDELAILLGVTKSGVNHRIRKLIELAESEEK